MSCRVEPPPAWPLGLSRNEVLNGGSSEYQRDTRRERGTATAWTAEDDARPGRCHRQLNSNAVWCRSATACTAVGDYDEQSWAMIETAGGSVERHRPGAVTDHPQPFKRQQLPRCTAVSCTVGHRLHSSSGGPTNTDSDDSETLAEVWNGTSWTIRVHPQTQTAPIDGSLAVQCRAARPPPAPRSEGSGNSSGDSSDVGGNVERHPRGVVQATPNPPGCRLLAQPALRRTVSCSSASPPASPSAAMRTLQTTSSP